MIAFSPAPRSHTWLLVFSLVLSLLATPARAAAPRSDGSETLRPAAPPPGVSAAAAVVLDWNTGRLLYGKNPHQRRAPASTTKIMTALLALETGRLNDRVAISRQAAATPGSSMGLRAGDQYSLEEMLYGLLLPSGNDAAVAIAEHIAGSVEGFVGLMNARATQLGLEDTQFVNPHGLTAPGHRSSAYDLALLTRHALSNPTFAELVRFKRFQACEEEGRVRELYNTNQLLWQYRWADGVKTGTTSVAGRCLVSSATQGAQRLIAVVLRSGDRFGEAQRLLEWGFDNFAFLTPAYRDQRVGEVPVAGGMAPAVGVAPENDLQTVVPRDRLRDFRLVINLAPRTLAPVVPGTALGTMAVTLDGQVLARTRLVAAGPVAARTLLRLLLRGIGSLFRQVAPY